MAFKKRYENSGTIGANRHKEKQNHADDSGSANITCPHCGVESDFWISGWRKDAGNGPFISLSFRAKDEQQGGQPQRQQQPRRAAPDAGARQATNDYYARSAPQAPRSSTRYQDQGRGQSRPPPSSFDDDESENPNPF